MVRKNPGVGNGDDEAAELMQQVRPSYVHIVTVGLRFPHKGKAFLLVWSYMIS
jgi:hypothetical protein